MLTQHRMNKEITVSIILSIPCILTSMLHTCYSCQILMNLGLSQQVFEKYSNIRFNESPSSDYQDVPCRPTDVQTDGRDKANMIKRVDGRGTQVKDGRQMYKERPFRGHYTTYL